jgi:hypothetical protein
MNTLCRIKFDWDRINQFDQFRSTKIDLARQFGVGVTAEQKTRDLATERLLDDVASSRLGV